MTLVDYICTNVRDVRPMTRAEFERLPAWIREQLGWRGGNPNLYCETGPGR